MKHLFILNPVAGGKRSNAAETEARLRSFAETLSDPFEIYITQSPMDAAFKVIADAEAVGDLTVYACGGDGTLNECVNGAAGRANVAVTHYPCGTGNDFIRMFGPSDAARFRDLAALANGDVRPIDLIDCNGRYGINICSVGIDARIGGDVHKYSRIPIIGGATGYVVSMAVNMLKGVRNRLRVDTREGAVPGDFSLICVCNGRFYGGGFNPVPDALPDDGVLESLIVKGVSRFTFLRLVGKYAKGRFRELGERVRYVRGDGLAVSGDGEFAVNIDGEIIHAKDMRFRILSGGVRFLFPRGMEFFGESARERETSHKSANEEDNKS